MTRRRYRWDEETGELYEVALDAPVTPRVELQTGNHYEGLRASDGTPIDTPKRHREYMARNGLALTEDYKQHWQDAPKQREAEQRRARREAIGRAAYEVLDKGRRRRA